MTTKPRDPDIIRIGHTDDFSIALARYQTWIDDANRLGFSPQSVGLVASGDPAGSWVVEVPLKLFRDSFSEVW